MAKLLDVDRIREDLDIFLDTHSEVSSSNWAGRMGVSRKAFFNFMHGAVKTHRKTVGRIKAYLDQYKQMEKEAQRCPHEQEENKKFQRLRF